MYIYKIHANIHVYFDEHTEEKQVLEAFLWKLVDITVRMYLGKFGVLYVYQ